MSKSNVSKNKMGKCLTFEEIGGVMDLSPQQVHKIEREAFNKIIKNMMITANLTIFETILSVSSFLGLDPEQAYKKLDSENLTTLSEYTKSQYGKSIKGIKNK